MPAEVVVVKRSRHRAFAVLRLAPAWLRSLWIAAWRNRGKALEADPFPLLAADSLPRLTRRPEVVFSHEGVHRCVGCNLCVRVCPSRCLVLETTPTDGPADGRGGEAHDVRVSGFGLLGERCIGCGVCARACPEDALEMRPVAAAALAPLSFHAVETDLLSTEGARG
ncbi:MAG: hypothetical protein CL908_26330 [Deltaproteobacteria bacterium]|jgi:ferredoxin|nr:hypothetical protein [Deltaproteobacteria bacterium]